jgi:UDP-N-acetylglucosamine 4,6-dehydratase
MSQLKHLILGGTGTLGREIATQLKASSLARLRVFSRDELKQKEMSDAFPKESIEFQLGDIRDLDALEDAMAGVHTVFHVAALKHIDWLEENPAESVKTNIIGTMNVIRAAERRGVRHVVFSSTDKAVDPLNVYGNCKAISEKLLLHRNSQQQSTLYSVYRWGNVLGSRGSFIHSVARTLKSDGKAYLTHGDMTRFWIRIEDAAKFLLSTYRGAPLHQPKLPTMKAAPIVHVIQVIAKLLGVDNYKILEIGKRPGEKLHEVLMTQHCAETVSSDTCEQYTDNELALMIAPILNLPWPPCPLNTDICLWENAKEGRVNP